MIGIEIDAAALGVAREDVAKLQQELTSQDLLQIGGRAIVNVLREHFELLSRDTEHHQTAQSLGAKRTGFYQEAAQSVQQPVAQGDDIVAISINGPEGLAQRYFGGTIEAKPGHALTIPARAEAYGRRADEFSNLRLIVFGDTGLAGLVEKDSPEDEGSVFYWLVRSVTQAADSTVLPEDEEMIEPALLAMREHIAAALEKSGA